MEDDDGLFKPKTKYEGLNTRRRVPPEQNAAQKAEEPEKKKEKDFFKRVSTWQYICVLFGMTAFWVLCFNPSWFPFHLLGGPGRRLAYLKDNYLTEMRIAFLVACLIHIVEALYAAKIAVAIPLTSDCRKKWILQTFLLGYSSLQHLLEYEKTSKDSSQPR